MELKEIEVFTNHKGEISCGNIGITKSEWLNLLKDPNAESYIEELLCILRMPMHKASCKMLAEVYGQQPQHYNSKVIAFSKWVQKKLNRFKVVRPGGDNCYWTIPMEKGADDKTGFVWYMRDELAEALQQYLIENLIENFQKKYKAKPFNGHDETYKWELINKDSQASTLDIIKSLKGVNIVSNMHVDGIFKYLIENHPDDIVACVDQLFDETIQLDIRLNAFKSGMKKIARPGSKIFANDERTAAALLTCKYPENYTIYMNAIYQYICNYLGLEVEQAGKKYGHYLKIIRSISQQYGSQIQSVIENDIKNYAIKPYLLATQTLFWCMQDEIKNSISKSNRQIWMVGCYINEDLSETFKKENIWKGQFNDDSESDQDLLETAGTFKKNDIIVLKSTGTKGIKHDKSFLRIKGVGIITEDIEFTKIEGATIGSCQVKYFKSDEIDFNGAYYGNYSKSINMFNPKHKIILDYIYSLLEQNTMPQSKYDTYIQLLKANRNLVLTGAPGTGKTYISQDIASAMHAETAFVQFHPSYDYTDFVEGLRPVQDKTSGQIGFERKDGIFKSFCKQAALNLIDSQKSIETLKFEKSWEERLNAFISDAIEKQTLFQLTTGNQFRVIEQTESNIYIYNENNPKTPNLCVSIEEILDLLTKKVPLTSVGDIRNYYGHKYRTQSDSYTFILINEMRKYYKGTPESEAKQVERKDFVFIIDEINRGEASKIFGELFYAIDPGYRENPKDEKKGQHKQRVQTQYQNLVPETDLFAEGFYVPENVYILATMNDIDRSVESMDFAMRRRFTWKEITPDDTLYMLEENLDSSILPEAIERLHNLNSAISEVDELGKAYMIGPSYFLKLKNPDYTFENLWKLNLEPLLKEYLRGTRKADVVLKKFYEAYMGESEKNDDENDND